MRRTYFFLIVAILISLLGACSLFLLPPGFASNDPISNPGGSTGGSPQPSQTFSLELLIQGSGTVIIHPE